MRKNKRRWGWRWGRRGSRRSRADTAKIGVVAIDIAAERVARRQKATHQGVLIKKNAASGSQCGQVVPRCRNRSSEVVAGEINVVKVDQRAPAGRERAREVGRTQGDSYKAGQKRQ